MLFRIPVCMISNTKIAKTEDIDKSEIFTKSYQTSACGDFVFSLDFGTGFAITSNVC